MRAPVLPAAAIAALYLLHQDLWFWTMARPLVFGVLPIGLAYHALHCLLAAVLMWWLTRVAWPGHLEPPAAASDPSTTLRADLGVPKVQRNETNR